MRNAGGPARRAVIGIAGAAGEAVTYLGPASWQGVATTYVRAIQDAGGAPVLLPPILDGDSVSAVIARLDGLVLTGGGDIGPSCYRQPPGEVVLGVDPDRDRAELQLILEALALHVPVLAICRGMQMLNVALRGTLVQHLADHPAHFDTDVAARHVVTVRPDSLLRRVTGVSSFRVNSLHHQAVLDLAPGLRVSAVADDGVVEALEIAGRDDVLGVQWHPELLTNDPRQAAFFAWLVMTSAARR